MKYTILFFSLFICLAANAQIKFTITQLDSNRYELRQIEVIDDNREVSTLLTFDNDSTITEYLNSMRSEAKQQIQYYYDRIAAYEHRLLQISKLSDRFDINIDLGRDFLVIVQSADDKYRASVRNGRIVLDDKKYIISINANDKMVIREGKDRFILSKADDGFYERKDFAYRIKTLY